MYYLVQQRHGTTSEWNQVGEDIIPRRGEIVVEFCENDKYRLKIGDGTTAYANLRYMSIDDFVKPETIIIELIGGDNWIIDTDENGTPIENRYYQEVTIANVTEKSKIDLQPTKTQLCIFHKKDIAFVVENNNGIVKVYAIGVRPEDTYYIQATITEVTGDITPPIYGDTTSTTIEFPTAPKDTDGEFILKATVTDGVVTYTWVTAT